MDNKSSADKIHMNSEDIASVIIGLGFLILVGVIFVVTITTMTTVDSFLIVWSAVGPIVGVVIGSMPAHFFRSMANTANARADGMVEGMANMAKDMAEMGKEMADTGADSK
jgi:hypothetical protein